MSDTPVGWLRSSITGRVTVAVVLVGLLGAFVASYLAGDAVRSNAEDQLVADAASVAAVVGATLDDAGWPTSPDGLTAVGRTAIEAAVAALGSDTQHAVVGPDGTVLSGTEATVEDELGTQALAATSSFLRERDGGDVVVAVPLARDGSAGFVSYVATPSAAAFGAVGGVRTSVFGAVTLSVVLILVLVLPLLRSHDRSLRERTNAIESLLERERADAVKLAEVDRLKDSFLTAVSHELRTPLTVIKGVGDLFEARADGLTPDKIRMLTGRMKSKVDRLEQLLGDLLDIDRLARGVLEPRRRATELHVVAARVVEDAQAEQHVVRLPEQSVTAQVDPGHAERIIENLVRNAVKYTPAGTRIAIRLEQRDGEVRINVADDGPGIPPEIRDTVFDPFVGGDPDGANPGLGGGLTLVQRLAEIHGGGAWLEDRADGGTSVWVRLPES